jgi:vancomycin permeability regulator SanA
MGSTEAMLAGSHRESTGGAFSQWQRRILGVLAAVGTLAAGVAGTNAWLAYRSTELAFADVASVPARDIAIVPGSRVTNQQPSPILRARLEAALALYRAGRVHAILISGAETPRAPETSVMRAWLRSQAVPEEHILTDFGGSRTRETMNRAAGLYDVTNAIVCTQTVNMARTLFLARAAGIDAVGVGLPTSLSRSKKYMAIEALKTTLAVVETILGPAPGRLPSDRSGRPAVAAR